MIPMTHVSFDTLKFVEKLIAAGMPAEQAKALSEAQKEVFEETFDGTLAKKADLTETENDLKTEIIQVKNELKAEIAEVRTEIAGVRADLKAEITEVKNELKGEIMGVKADIKLLRWMMGFLLAGVGTLLTGAAALVIKAFFG